MSAADRLDQIEARNVPITWFADRQSDTAALVAALRAVLDEVAKVQRDADAVAINPRPGGKVLAGERWRVAEQFRVRIEEALK